MTVTDQRPPAAKQRYRPGSLEIFGLILLTGIVLRGPLQSWFSGPAMQTWATTFVSVCIQAIPFLVLGVVVSGAIAAFVPSSFFTRILPKSPALAVPVAGVCGIGLPGCECSSIPIANRLMDRGVRPSAALAFLLSAPAINPIVLVATAVIVGWIWERIGRPEWLRPRLRNAITEDARGWSVFLNTMRGDFTQAAGFLVLGGGVAATFKVLVSQGWMQHIGSSLVLSVLLMAGLTYMLALCSEAD